MKGRSQTLLIAIGSVVLIVAVFLALAKPWVSSNGKIDTSRANNAPAASQETAGSDKATKSQKSSPEGADADVLRDVVKNVHSVDPAFLEWESATYQSFVSNGTVSREMVTKLVQQVPVNLNAPMAEPQYEGLVSTVSDLVELYASFDATKYVDLLKRGNATPEESLVEKFRAELTNLYGRPATEVASMGPVGVFQAHFAELVNKLPQQKWEGLALELSSITIDKGQPDRTIADEMSQKKSNGSLITTNLLWTYPHEELKPDDTGTLYATVVLQLNHLDSKVRFPRTFLLVWDSKFEIWRIKEAYAQYGQDTAHRIFL
jgi:hypothetical protein